MMGTLRTLAELRDWCRKAPPGTRLDAHAVAELLEQTDDVPPAAPEAMHQVAEDWRTRLWHVPGEVRLGVAEVAEALGRPKSFVYARTGPKAECVIPHRKLDGALVFTAGELRAWIRDHEEVVAAGPMDPPSRPRLAS